MGWALDKFLKMQLILKAAEQYERLVDRRRSGAWSQRQAGRERGLDVDSLLPSKKSEKNGPHHAVKRWRTGKNNNNHQQRGTDYKVTVQEANHHGDGDAGEDGLQRPQGLRPESLPTAPAGLSSTSDPASLSNSQHVQNNGCFVMPVMKQQEFDHHTHLVHHALPKSHSKPKTKPSSRNNKVPVDAKDSMTILQLLALNALELTIPASDFLLKNRQNSWVQLSGHPGSFAPAGPGTVWKKQSSDNNESLVYEALMKDTAADIVPKYHRAVSYENENFIEMQDLLCNFIDPKLMDIKMGTRTFLESEVTNTTARTDLYEKMVKVDPSAPTPAEHASRAVTKLRYMTFREQQSSTCQLGFRIEAIKLQGSPPMSDLKSIRTKEEVANTLALFLSTGGGSVKEALLARLRVIRDKFARSPYFQTHEVVGSSILIIYDATKVGAWIIDFAKTMPLPGDVKITHTRPWVQGNHEEGYLIGLDNLTKMIEEIKCVPVCDSTKSRSSVLQ